MYQHNLGPVKASALSVIIAHLWALKVIAKFWRQSQFKISRCMGRCIACCPCFAPSSCYSCHDPFIVRSAQTCPPSTGFHSACTSVSMFTINVDNCLFSTLVLLVFLSPWGSVFTLGLQPFTRSIIGFVNFIL